MEKAYIVWFVLAFALLAIELGSGTFYLLVLGIAAAIGGVASLLGLDLPLQILVVALISIVGVLILMRWRGKNPPRSTRSDDFDIGQRVAVKKWHDSNSLRITYRGSDWDAELESDNVDRDMPLYIVDRRGSTLILSNKSPKTEKE